MPRNSSITSLDGNPEIHNRIEEYASQLAQQYMTSSSSTDNTPAIENDHSVHSLISSEEEESITSDDIRSHRSEEETSEIIEHGRSEDHHSEDNRAKSDYPGSISSESEESESQPFQKGLDETEDELNIDHSRRTWDVLRHTTISQDQTAASSFRREQLLALQDNCDRKLNHDLSTTGPLLTGDQVLRDFEPQLYFPTLDEHIRKSRTERDKMNRMERPDQEPANESVHLQDSPADMLGQLMARIRVLEQENSGLRGLFKNPLVDLKRGLPQSPRWQVLYRFGKNRLFLAEPSWILGEAKKLFLAGALPLSDPAQYFQRHTEIAFVIYKTYSETAISGSRVQAFLEEEVMPRPKPEFESLELVSDDMVEAFVNFSRKQTDFKQIFPDFDHKAEILAPYLFWYHYRSSCSPTLQELSPRHLALMELLGLWIDTQYGKTYIDADSRLSEGFTNRRLMTYLVRPGDILISRDQHGHNLAHMATSWAADDNAERSAEGEIAKELNGAFTSFLPSKKEPWIWRVECWSYGFDGTFYKKVSHLNIELRTENPNDEVDMKDLNILPLRFAGRELKRELERRGEIFWSCRSKRFVSYRVQGTDDLNNDGERFMIDFPTYKKLHGDSLAVSMRTHSKREEIPAEVIALETPPLGPELLLFPPIITGYNLRRKKWVDLEVDHIIDVTWNKRAIDNLVVDEETQELIQALVKNKLAGEKSTDLISGKGNGLIILLHGGPGTGKTFTAESVAEMAEKPLYRVTCGDIGTQPEAVEKYLESVLHLGKIWDCVVLLDEADVFLEERGLADLQRNALVSVFLRVLEYYDGILILTSNRVGTFDEAFKSRIQLALHYENLTLSQRKKIWRNFINRLKSLDDQKIDFDDIDCYIDELASHEMNGRQIRNAITTARQLAQYKEKSLSYTHLKHVIGVAGKFDKYLEDVKGDRTDTWMARANGLR